MIGKSILNEKPITNAEAKRYLSEFEEQYKKKEKAIGYELEQSLKHTTKFSKVTEKEAKEMKKALHEFKIPEKVIVELINIKPQTQDLVKSILFKRAEVKEDDIDKILKILNK